MMEIVNFSAGPAILAPEVKEAAAAAMRGLPEFGGLSVAEISHRSAYFSQIIEEAEATLRRLLAVPDSHAILFLQGGARGHFAQIPLNWLKADKKALYVDTGKWAAGAYEAALPFGAAEIVASGEETGYRSLPEPPILSDPDGIAYVHTTSNNTIFGTQWQELPDFGGVPHVCDMSSDILSRPIDVGRFGLIYAGAQKNAGIAGLTLVIVRKAWLEEARRDLPEIWQYRVQAEKKSLYHTPPTFPIYVTLLVARWLESQGGLAAIQRQNELKAQALYDEIDGSGGFYQALISEPDRSRMNITFTLRDEGATDAFVQEAWELGLQQIKGHRDLGGIRVSLYNALPASGLERLLEFMRAFQTR